jgi:hypothetical protein
MTNKSAILVWAWDNAPDEFKALSTHGGDEDFVIVADADSHMDNCEWLVEKIDHYQGMASRTEYTTTTPGAIRDVVVWITAHA